ncbi:MAG: lipoyl(octanoyl) transferase LipB [Xanthobacteraceae bacterium]|nr:lipoyl(octanoyl) transferase LipB [Xanthobacteraceae bacterium]
MVNAETRPQPSGVFGETAGLEWLISATPVGYAEAVAEMEARTEAIARRDKGELIWLLEHPALITAGTSAGEGELLVSDRFPVFKAGRGGRYTYHGPGQRVGYVMLDLKARGGDVRKFVHGLEEWLIRTLGAFGVTAERREGRIGVWVARPDKGAGYEDKIAALGIRVRKGITFHGVSLNVSPDLSHFSAIMPCGVSEQRYGVTSLADLSIKANMADVNEVLREKFTEVFG